MTVRSSRSFHGRPPKLESWPKAERLGSVRPQPDRGREPRRNGPTVSSPRWQREPHPEEALQLRNAHALRSWRPLSVLSASRIPLSRRCKSLSDQHGSMPRCNQWRAGSSLRSSSSNGGGGGCEGLGCRCRDNADFRGESFAGWRRASRIPFHPQLRSLVAELQRERQELWSELGQMCCHTTPGGSATQVNSVIVNTSIRGDQLREQSEPVSVDGDIDRRWISSGVPSIAPHAVANWPCACRRRESRCGLRGVRVGESV